MLDNPHRRKLACRTPKTNEAPLRYAESKVFILCIVSALPSPRTVMHMLLQMIPDITTFLLSHCRPFYGGDWEFPGALRRKAQCLIVDLTCSLITPIR